MFSVLPCLPPSLLSFSLSLPLFLLSFLCHFFVSFSFILSVLFLYIFQMVSLMQLRLSLNLPSSSLNVQSAEITSVLCYHGLFSYFTKVVHFLFCILAFPFLMLFQVLCACLTARSFKTCHLRLVHILRHYEKKECLYVHCSGEGRGGKNVRGTHRLQAVTQDMSEFQWCF